MKNIFLDDDINNPTIIDDDVVLVDELLSLSDVNSLRNILISSVSTDNFLVYNISSSKWINKSPSDTLVSLGLTASAVELNYNDISTLGLAESSKTLTFDSSGLTTLPDNFKIQIGTGSDLQLYHDGTDSFLTNAVGVLKIATETSGVPVQIGHSTSEVTVGQNLTVTGDLSVDSSVLKVDSLNNRVGIGTATPAKALHVVDTTGDAEIARFEGGDGNISVNGGAKITFSRNAINYLTCTDIAGSLRLETGGAGNNRLTIDSSGNSTFTGDVILDNAKSLRLSELDSNGTNHISIKAPDSVTSDVTLVLPDGAGTNGQALTTNGSGNLSWSTVAVGLVSSDITGQTAKTSISDNDLVVIADSQNSNNLKKMTRANFVDGLTANNTYSAKTANFTAAVNYHYSVNTTSGAITVSLPQISSTTAGESLVVKFRSGTNTLTLSPYSGNTIEGLANLVLTDSSVPGQSVTLVSDGSSAWEIV